MRLLECLFIWRSWHTHTHQPFENGEIAAAVVHKSGPAAFIPVPDALFLGAQWRISASCCRPPIREPSLYWTFPFNWPFKIETIWQNFIHIFFWKNFIEGGKVRAVRNALPRPGDWRKGPPSVCWSSPLDTSVKSAQRSQTSPPMPGEAVHNRSHFSERKCRPLGLKLENGKNLETEYSAECWNAVSCSLTLRPTSVKISMFYLRYFGRYHFSFEIIQLKLIKLFAADVIKIERSFKLQLVAELLVFLHYHFQNLTTNSWFTGNF